MQGEARGPGSLPTEIAAAPERTAAAGSARVTLYAALDTPVPSAGALRGKGLVSFPARRSQVTSRLVTDDLLSESDRRDGRVLRRIKRAAGHPYELVFEGGRRYIRIEGGVWSSDDARVVGPRQTDDPLWNLDALAGANSDAGIVGHEEVEGAATTRWRLTIDLHKADQRFPAGLLMPDRARRRLLRRTRDTRWQTHVPAEVWLDSSGRVCRIAVAAFAHLTKPGTRTVWFVTDLADFGIPADITVPPETAG